MSEKDKVQVTFLVERDVYDILDDIREAYDISLAEVCRRLINRGLAVESEVREEVVKKEVEDSEKA